jgi:hypothetical protein
MKRFDVPRMERIDLASESIIFSSLCSAQYCDGHQCPQCEEDDTTCYEVSPCSMYNCGHVLCTTYEG